MAQTKKYVDVNVFVYWLGNNPEFGDTARKWINEIENSSSGSFVTSSLSLYEALVTLAGLADKTLKDNVFVESILKALNGIKGLMIEPLRPADYSTAVDLMDECALDYEDSLHLAVAIRTGTSEIVSNDKHFNATPLKRRY
jgi:predicted nucleic acid-binding protein